MNTAGPQLHDIHLPQLSWWPPAIGWWLLATLILLAFVALFFVWLRGRRTRALRRATQRELAALAARYARDRNDLALTAGLSRLLRRIALLLRPEVAAKNDSAWRAFLSDCAHPVFTNEQLDALIEAPYRAHVSLDAETLLAATWQWCVRALRPRASIARSARAP